MKLEDMILISTDDHICEPPTVFDNVPKSLRERMPKFARDANGIDAWEFNGRRMPNFGLNAVAGRRPEEYGVEPCSFDALRKGCYDVDARVDDMSVNGQLAGLNFPQVGGVAGQAFLTDDRSLSYSIVQAYNDWHIDEWCGAHPARFIPNGIVPFWDLEQSIAEVKRIKAKGCHAISLLPVPNREGFPSWNSGYWDPLLAVCEDLEVVINLHISDAVAATPSPESPVDVFITNLPGTLYATASDIVWSHITRKYPNVKFALSEGGAGWVSAWKERADFTYSHHRAWTHQDFGNLTPSEVFDRQFITCFIKDRTAIVNRATTNIDRMTWECDYPHSDCTWPKSPEAIFPDFEGCTDEEINKITHLNAMRMFQFDPFKIMPREQCTVGALRASAAHVDTSYLPSTGIIHTTEDGKTPSMREVAEKIAKGIGANTSWIGDV
jgi:predicted TIM-barrel fold metal-dependent hydrolase